MLHATPEPVELVPPRVEGTVEVRDDRRLSYAEYGDPDGPARRLDARHPSVGGAGSRWKPDAIGGGPTDLGD